MIPIRICIAAVFTFLYMNATAQLKIDAELRPRFEYRHGYKTLFPAGVDPASFVSQRTRLKVTHKSEKLDFFLSVQDVRVWGDVAQLNVSDKNGLSVHEAWAQISLTKNLALKLGRQEIIYDDSRIFGNVNWSQQGRSHDLAMLKYLSKGFRFDLGLAFNQSGERLAGAVLTTRNTYKAFQYLWLHHKWQNLSGSLLLLNNGLQFIDESNPDNSETRYSQTLGTHLVYTKNKLDISSNLYYQFGKDRQNNSLSAYLLGIETKYKLSPKVKAGVGLELQSGNDKGIPSEGKNNAFTPFYGTNHKFNGFMDYFYTGNHIDNVGLLDVYVSANIAFSGKSGLNVAFHNFSAPADLEGYNKKQLGNELDLSYSYNIRKNVILKAGYSHMFAGEGMEILKNSNDNCTDNWAWVMMIIKPTLFKGEK